MYKPLLIFLTLVWAFLPLANAQRRLKIDLSARCIFHPAGQEEELYEFPTQAPEVQELVADILNIAGEKEQYFVLIQANVENVSAVVDSNGRYLLWNQEFWEKADDLLRYAAFAHEICHHLSLHRLTAAYRNFEEQEADIFMGFVLSLKNYPPGLVMDRLGIRDSKLLTDPYDRKEAFLRGYYQAQKSLQIASLAFENDPSWEAFQKASFPFPPPPCYQTANLSRPPSFSGCQTLGSVAQKIGAAFAHKGYPYRFMSIPNENGVPEGFAVVTQLEQYEEDGRATENPSLRWTELPQAEQFSLSLNYFKKLLFPRPAHLRIFAVLVTQQAYASNGKRVSKEAAKAWADQGLNRLPKTIAQKPFGADYNVDVLVYEFEVPETTHRASQQCPCHLDARRHLQASGLDVWLK